MPALESLFQQSCGLQHSCFSVNFVKFLRTPFFTEHLRWLLLLLRMSGKKEWQWVWKYSSLARNFLSNQPGQHIILQNRCEKDTDNLERDSSNVALFTSNVSANIARGKWDYLLSCLNTTCCNHWIPSNPPKTRNLT